MDIPFGGAALHGGGKSATVSLAIWVSQVSVALSLLCLIFALTCFRGTERVTSAQELAPSPLMLAFAALSGGAEYLVQSVSYTLPVAAGPGGPVGLGVALG